MEIILVRHGESTANVAGVLAGRSDAVSLTARGRTQVEEARALVPELTAGGIPVLTSPVARCVATARILSDGAVEPEVLESLAEVDYGEWTGRSIRDLLQEDLWKVVRSTPGLARFPGGESLPEVAARSHAALTAALARGREAGSRSVVLVSHGDPIKLALAHALDLGLERFQRIAVAPASVSRIRVMDDGAADRGESDAHGPAMVVTMLGATAAGRRAESSVPGGGK